MIMKVRKPWIFLMFLYFLTKVQCSELNFVINPGCENYCEKPWLIYGSSDSEGNHTQVDSTHTHYLYGSVETPVFLIASSDFGSSLNIDWNGLQEGKPGAVTFNPIPNNVFGMQFQQIILFNDPKDTGELGNNDRFIFPLQHFQWSCRLSSKNSNKSFTAVFETISYKDIPVNNSKISISITAYIEEGRDDNLPHLNVGPKSVQIEVLLDNLVVDFRNISKFYSDLDGVAMVMRDVNKKHHHHSHADISGFSSPRWALDVVVISDDVANLGGNDFNFVSLISLDDEYAPGVFKLDNIESYSSKKSTGTSNSGGYIQYRPVCYLTPDDDVNYSTTPNLNETLPKIDESHYKLMTKSLLYATFGDLVTKLSGFQTTVAFGQPKDEFYTSFNYTKWTFSMGLGAVPEEHFSTTVIVVICVGVGIPIVLLLIGSVFLGVRKIMKKKRTQELLINEDN